MTCVRISARRSAVNVTNALLRSRAGGAHRLGSQISKTADTKEKDVAVETAPIEHRLQLALAVAWTPIEMIRIEVLPEINWRNGTMWLELSLGANWKLDRKIRI